jgi:D-3-phosphoglycerate dehydrogenase / 2-oxoglutarate reductase
MQKIKILLVENIHSIAVERLSSEGFEVDQISHAPDENELLKILPQYQVLGIRSKTQISDKVILANPQLHTIGAFCIGTNQINLKAANKSGVPVFNAPHSNTRSVAEMVIAELIILSRQLGDRNILAHKGEWLKSADGSREVRGKTLGIVGYGHIGSQVSILAESLGLHVLFFDVIKKLPLGNAHSCLTMDELLAQSDFLTLHVPETAQTMNLIGKRELQQMKKGAAIINASRGTVIHIESLVEALKSQHISGAALDVFPDEPASNKEKFHSPLQGIPNVFLTPHIGGSTIEAQYAIGLEVAESFRRFLKLGTTSGAVNFPQVDIPLGAGIRRIINVHRNEPGVLGEINGVVSKYGANIQAQSLSTDNQIGYLVMDVEKAEAESLSKDIAALARSIKTRVVKA